jgi:hypothetical protein
MRALPLVFLALAACSNDAGMAERDADTGWQGDSADIAVGGLRIDVSPPAGVGEPALLPQSHLEPGPSEGLRLDLFRTVVWSGTLTAEVVRGWSGAAEVPTTEEPLAATLNASVSETRLGGSVQSDDAGAFVLELPAYDDLYDLTIVPIDADLAPFHWEQRLFDDDRTDDLELSPGMPVYGRVTDATGVGIPRVAMRVVRTDVALGEVASAYFETDETGWYVARVEEAGSYAVEVLGGETGGAGSRVVPTLREEVLVDDPSDGASVDVELGVLEDAVADGSVFDAAGDEVDGVKLRFTSETLDGANGSLVVETETDDGRWIADLLPGRWTVEAIPPYDMLASPVSTTVEISAGSNAIEDLFLEPPSQITGTIDAPAGTTIQAKQRFGDHNVYPGTVDQQGNFLMDLPAGDYLVTFEPPSGSLAGAITYAQIATGEEVSLTLEPGEPLSGVVAFDDVGVAYAVLRVYDRDTGVLVGRSITDETGGFSLLVPALAVTDMDTGD